VACGSVSGFHSLVSSAVTSKQLNKMKDARLIGYSAMLGESALSALVVIACCSSGHWASTYGDWPMKWGDTFIPGVATLLEALGVPLRPARAVVIVLVVSFAATTLDSAMRIHQVLVGELGRIATPRLPRLGKALQSVVVSGLLIANPSCWLANSRVVESLWNLFGAANQLVACLSLAMVAVYVVRLHNFDLRFALPFFLPMFWLGFFISWALGRTIAGYFATDVDVRWVDTVPTYPSIVMAVLLAVLFVALILEVVWYFLSGKYLQDRKICPRTGKIQVWPEESEVLSESLSAFGCC